MEGMYVKHLRTRFLQLCEELDGGREVIVLARGKGSDPMNSQSISSLLNVPKMPRWVRGYHRHVIKEFPSSLRHLRNMGLYSPNVRGVSWTHQYYTIHEIHIASLGIQTYLGMRLYCGLFRILGSNDVGRGTFSSSYSI